MRFSLAPTLVIAALAATGTIALAQTDGANAPAKTPSAGKEPRSPDGKRYLSPPLVTSIYTADPSAHVFNGKIYV
ncbi:hypothetical protein KC217_21115, partial [Mycobacterium tuberculosis]|nr:hypothetical protein [Mycobacterium tuberculosis]